MFAMKIRELLAYIHVQSFVLHIYAYKIIGE